MKQFSADFLPWVVQYFDGARGSLRCLESRTHVEHLQMVSLPGHQIEI